MWHEHQAGPDACIVQLKLVFDVVKLLLLTPQSLSCGRPLHIQHVTPFPAHIEALAHLQRQQQADLTLLAEQAQASSGRLCSTTVRLPSCSRGQEGMAGATQGWHTTCLCQMT